jgi:hypothetical protein
LHFQKQLSDSIQLSVLRIRDYLSLALANRGANFDIVHGGITGDFENIYPPQRISLVTQVCLMQKKEQKSHYSNRQVQAGTDYNGSRHDQQKKISKDDLHVLLYLVSGARVVCC